MLNSEEQEMLKYLDKNRYNLTSMEMIDYIHLRGKRRKKRKVGKVIEELITYIKHYIRPEEILNALRKVEDYGYDLGKSVNDFVPRLITKDTSLEQVNEAISLGMSPSNITRAAAQGTTGINYDILHWAIDNFRWMDVLPQALRDGEKNLILLKRIISIVKDQKEYTGPFGIIASAFNAGPSDEVFEIIMDNGPSGIANSVAAIAAFDGLEDHVIMAIRHGANNMAKINEVWRNNNVNLEFLDDFKRARKAYLQKRFTKGAQTVALATGAFKDLAERGTEKSNEPGGLQWANTQGHFDKHTKPRFSSRDDCLNGTYEDADGLMKKYKKDQLYFYAKGIGVTVTRRMTKHELCAAIVGETQETPPPKTGKKILRYKHRIKQSPF